MSNADCPDCGEPFDPSRGGKSGPRSKLCRTCQKAASKDRKAGMEAMRNAMKAGAQNAVFVSPREVYTRDNWTCHICGLEVPQELRNSRRIEVAGYNPLSPSLDHVISCKLGGDHTLDNLKAAHHSCNARKNAGNAAPGAVATVSSAVVAEEDRCAVAGCPRPRHTKLPDGTYVHKNRLKMCRVHNHRVRKGSGDPLKALCGCGCKQLVAVTPEQSGLTYIPGHHNNAATPTIGEQLAVRYELQPVTSYGRALGLSDDCQVWTGAKHAAGYGVVYLHGRARSKLVHRAAYAIAHGEGSIRGLVVDHLCRNRACFNINHLEAVTHAENVRRGDRRGRGVKRTA